MLAKTVKKVLDPLRSFLNLNEFSLRSHSKKQVLPAGFAFDATIPEGFHVYGVFPKPRSPNEMMLGAGNPSTGEGKIFISNEGKWQSINVPADTALVSKILYLEKNICLAGGMNSIGRGVLMRSTDLGQTWKNATIDLYAYCSIEDLIRLPDGSVLASVGKTRIQGETTATLLRSVDQGLSWTPEEVKLPVQLLQSLLMDSDNRQLFAACKGDEDPKVYISTDHAKTWNDLPSFPKYTTYKMPWMGHYRDRNQRKHLLVLIWGYKKDIADRVVRLYRLNEEKALWEELPPIDDVSFVFAFYVDRKEHFWVGTEKGRVYRSKDYGQTWSMMADFPSNIGAYCIYETEDGEMIFGKDFVYPRSKSLWRFKEEREY